MQKNLNIEKITFKVVQMKFLAMHITNQKLSFDIFTVGNLQNIFMEHDLNILMIFGIKEKCIVGYCYKYTCAAYDCFCAKIIYILIKVKEEKSMFMMFIMLVMNVLSYVYKASD